MLAPWLKAGVGRRRSQRLELEGAELERRELDRSELDRSELVGSADGRLAEASRPARHRLELLPGEHPSLPLAIHDFSLDWFVAAACGPRLRTGRRSPVDLTVQAASEPEWVSDGPAEESCGPRSALGGGARLQQ